MEERALQRSTHTPNAHLNGEGGYKREQQASQPGRATHTHVSPPQAAHTACSREADGVVRSTRGAPALAQRCVPSSTRTGGLGQRRMGQCMAAGVAAWEGYKDTAQREQRYEHSTLFAQHACARRPSKAPMPQAIHGKASRQQQVPRSGRGSLAGTAPGSCAHDRPQTQRQPPWSSVAWRTGGLHRSERACAACER